MNTALLIDIGNTSATAALAAGARIRRVLRLPAAMAAGRPAAVRALLGRLAAGAAPRRSAICSVVPAATGIWQTELRRLTGNAPLLIRHTLNLGVKLNYPRPATIGADRLANAAAAWQRYGVPVMVADFGTALTLDAVDARGCFIGGLILPGPALFLDYLAERTACLPRLDAPPPRAARRAIARNTRAAMQAGAILGWRGMFREALTAMRAEMPADAAVCATGGYARRTLAGTDWPMAIQVDPHLTLRGIQIIMDLNY